MNAQTLLNLARAKGLRIAVAESCTGGLLAGALTEVAGASDVFDCGFVTYSNAAKVAMLGVARANLDQFGAVSEQVAQDMAQGALDLSNAQLSVAITGIAGPGGSEFKPEGRVCFALATAAGVTAHTVEFGAIGRGAVRFAADSPLAALLAESRLPLYIEAERPMPPGLAPELDRLADEEQRWLEAYRARVITLGQLAEYKAGIEKQRNLLHSKVIAPLASATAREAAHTMALRQLLQLASVQIVATREAITVTVFAG
jgi:nicotinamide-nucleotide amidase